MSGVTNSSRPKKKKINTSLFHDSVRAQTIRYHTGVRPETCCDGSIRGPRTQIGITRSADERRGGLATVRRGTALKFARGGGNAAFDYAPSSCGNPELGMPNAVEITDNGVEKVSRNSRRPVPDPRSTPSRYDFGRKRIIDRHLHQREDKGGRAIGCVGTARGFLDGESTEENPGRTVTVRPYFWKSYDGRPREQ